jgi:hypothetical protein
VKNAAAIGKFTLCFLILWCVLSCGLDSISYLDNIPESNYRDVTGATVMLPSGYIESYSDFFDYFVIYYRIYISGVRTTGRIDTDTARTNINSMMNNDFIYLERYTDTVSTTVYPLTHDTFPSRGYYKLELEGPVANYINTVLGSSSLGNLLAISFNQSPGDDPVLILNGNRYVLQRAIRGPGINFAPIPSRRFLNDQQLYNSSNAISPSQSSTYTNADVYGRSVTEENGLPSRYTYVSMYIVAQGTDHDMPPQTIFSQPTFLGIFLLAEAN